MITIRKAAIRPRGELDEWTQHETTQLTCDWCGADSKQTDEPYIDLADWELVVAGHGRRNMCPECAPAEK